MGDQVMIKVKIISDSGIYPEYETEGSAGMDIRAYIDEPVIIKPGERKLIPTGLRIQLPAGLSFCQNGNYPAERLRFW